MLPGGAVQAWGDQGVATLTAHGGKLGCPALSEAASGALARGTCSC